MKRTLSLYISLLIALFAPSMAQAQVVLDAIYANGMVLQRETPVLLRGTANAGAVVSAHFNELPAVEGLADAKGRWSLSLPAMDAGGPHTLRVTSGNTTRTLTDVYIGDVWLASGQSNMEMALSQVQVGTSVNEPLIRQFKVQKGLANEPSAVLPSSAWTKATSSAAGAFSAVAFYFARDLRAHVDVPIGILNISYGGSRIETWMSDEMLGYDETDRVLANGEPERQPTLAFNKMINPVIGFPIKGFLWYQGESNADNMEDALAYGALFRTMIQSWRTLWGQGDLPFLWVQLPGYGTPAGDQPSTWDAWPRLRVGQSSALALPNTGEAITIDVGDTDIHPKNKLPVGVRLSTVARHVAYGEDIVYSGPRYVSNVLEENGRVRVRFTHTGGGLVAEGSDAGVLSSFALGDDSGRFVWANAEVDGEEVVLWSDAVPEPAEVRYAWEYNPADANLYNAEGLPAAPFRALVNPGFGIAAFSADRMLIETGQSTTLTWMVYGAETVTLNGAPVDTSGTLVIQPAETTTYTLLATKRGEPDVTETASLKVEVMDAGDINRALNRPATASSYESCCGPARLPAFAVDGVDTTRWTSAWSNGENGTTLDPNFDGDPSDEWLAVDLGSVIDISRVVIAWEAAYATEYDLEVSYDGYRYERVYRERQGNGGQDVIAFETPVSGRFLRLHALQRGTQWGYSVWEMAAYGTVSEKQPPTVQIGASGGNIGNVGATVALSVTATDADGTVAKVAFYADGQLISEDESAPYTASWVAGALGESKITAVATDNDGLSVQSPPLLFYVVGTAMATRYEAENAVLTGGAAVIASAATSGGKFVEGRDAWTLTFPDVQAATGGDYLLVLGYQLTFESPKAQYLVVDGDTVETVEFTAPSATQWMKRGVRVSLGTGSHEVAIHGFWNWMSFDYLDLIPLSLLAPVEPSAPGGTDGLGLFVLPNPFSHTATLQYSLSAPGPVRLDVFDLAGRRVATLVEGVQAAGTHTALFEGTALASGVYLYRIEASGESVTGRMTLVR